MEGKLASDNLNRITGSIVDAAIDVHRELGPGLLESAYETCLAHELAERGLTVQRQIALPIRYKGLLLDDGYRIDLLVSKKVVVELKVVDMIKSVHKAQLLSYLKLSNCPVGLLINFNEYQLKRGIKRFVN
ncbi:MAG TPA: GxxExxY protein [Gammaproteobacteria bacterium]|nr:GxxExxY protein [Gammaproteobacteria bacterium]